MKYKKDRTIIKKIILFPLSAILIVSAIMITSTIVAYLNIEKLRIDNEINSIQISLNQLKNQLDQIDNEFVQFVSSNKSYINLSNMDKSTPKSQYLIYQADIMERLENQAMFYENIGGVFSYFENMDLLIFRGNDVNKWNMHSFFVNQLQENMENIKFNHWKIVEVNGRKHLTVIKKYANYYWGCWMPLEPLITEYALDHEEWIGEIYISDNNNINSLKNPELNEIIQTNGVDLKKVSINNKTYKNFSVSIYNGDITFGSLIPKFDIFDSGSFFNKVLFIAAFIPFFLAPIIAFWLQKEIVYPLKKMDVAMKAIRQGDLEYQITMPEKLRYNEFDRLTIKFNEMMKDINDLEFNLYKAQISKQRTELKYISQQIRPHFILNALNIIYTYKEEEMFLVRKMILYLTEYFRYIINLKYDFVNISAEFRHADNYLKIQKERYPERFDYKISIEEDLELFLIPPLLIQTFLENCMKYAIKNNEKLYIQVSAEKREEYLSIIIKDNGNGFSNDTLELIEKFIRDRTYQNELGVGIQNTIERLDLVYKNQYKINISNNVSGGARIEIIVPRQMQE